MSLRFEDLFIGGEQAHGTWDAEAGAKTEKAPATADHYARHLAGDGPGLGLVPVRLDGTCRFAAIDIDDDHIDHAALYRKILKRKLPLTVCRSKSGGAHLYLFMDGAGVRASKVQVLLKKWAGLLGYPTAEIFPKQTKVDRRGNLGNWINLPYYGGERTTRYAFGPEGAITLDVFLSSVQFYDPKAEVDETPAPGLKILSQMPPCLATLTEEGLPEGSRNEGLFNFAVFYRKAHPNGWEDKVAEHNQKFLKPPLSLREVQSIIKSAGRTQYQYRCNQEPIVSRCNRKVCLTLPFGVGCLPWEDAGNYDEVLVTHCRKILTDPPRYILEVNGNDVELATEQFLDFRKFRLRVIELMDIMPRRMKQERWEQLVRDLLAKRKDIEAPDDASGRGQILDRCKEFLSLHERSRGDADCLLRGLPLLEDKFVYFRAADLLKFLKTTHKIEVQGNLLFQLLHWWGCQYKSRRLKGRVITIWYVAQHHLNDQTEDFALPDFGKNIGEEL